jgi:hypothetical protein
VSPTYLAVSIMCITNAHLPEMTLEVPGFMPSFQLGLAAASQRLQLGSVGDGILALQILRKGRVPKCVAQRPELCPEMFQKLRELSVELANSSTLGGFYGFRGNDRRDREEMRDILKWFR